MDFKALGWLLLLAAVLVQTGCATERKTYDDTTPDDSPQMESDSHGWGASVQGH